MRYDENMLNSIKFLRKYLRAEKKCCNFASAIGKQTGGSPEGRGHGPGAEKIEYNDMMPQDKQRRQRCRSSRDKGTREKLGVSVAKIPTLNKEGRDKQRFEDIYRIYI